MDVRKLAWGFAASLAVLSLVQVGRTAEPERVTRPTGESFVTDNSCLGSGCADNCCAEACCQPCWQAYAEFLYLRPRNAGLEYAVPIDGSIAQGAVPLQVGRTGTVDPQFEPGFRVGFSTQFDGCSSVGASYTHYENGTDDSISVDPPYVIRSMVAHPSSFDAAADWLSASAHQQIDFDIADIDYRRVFMCGDRYTASYLLGVRYVNLKQSFDSQFDSIITGNVNSNVNFDGGGIRLGLEAERHAACHNIFLYGKASASLLGGEFRGNYLQGASTDPVIAETTWNEARFVSILDCELGVGWTSCNDHVRLSAGYMFSGWLNVVKTSEFISAVQANNYHGPNQVDGNGLVFDGLVTRAEFRW